MLDNIEREIVLTGPLTEEQRTRLLEIANKCPSTEPSLPKSRLIRGWLRLDPPKEAEQAKNLGANETVNTRNPDAAAEQILK